MAVPAYRGNVFPLFNNATSSPLTIDEDAAEDTAVSDIHDAFGIFIAKSGGTQNTYLGTGEQLIRARGLYYLRARLMNPLTGRFWSADSFEGDEEDPASLHKYLYANADPISGIDPTGHATFTLGETQITVSISSYLAATAASFVVGKGVSAIALLTFQKNLDNFRWFEWWDLLSFVPGGVFSYVTATFVKLPIQLLTRVGGKLVGEAFAHGLVPQMADWLRVAFAQTGGKVLMKTAMGKTVELEAGSASKGFVHILRRHLVGMWDGGKKAITTFFPSTTTPADVVEMLQEAVRKYSRVAGGAEDIVLSNGLTVRLVIGGGKVITFFPVSGEGVVLSRELVKNIP